MKVKWMRWHGATWSFSEGYSAPQAFLTFEIPISNKKVMPGVARDCAEVLVQVKEGFLGCQY